MTRYNWPPPHIADHDQLPRRLELGTLADWFTPDRLLADIMAARAAYMRIIADLALLGDQDLWLPAGPSTMIEGQATGEPEVAGRVRDLKVTADGTRAYAGSANGGVWYSNDGGQSWSPLGSWGLHSDLAVEDRAANSLTIGALDVHFGATEAQDVVYAATGELQPALAARPGAKFGGVGVLRLDGSVRAALDTPGDIPWKREAPNLTGLGIYRLTHDPAADLAFSESGTNTMVAAASNGLYTRSGAFVEDAEWTRVSDDDHFDFDADDGVACTDVLWTPSTSSPSRPARLWVAITDEDGDRTDVYTSTGGPNGTYERVNLPGRAGSGRLGLAAAPGHPEIVYVLGKRPNRQARVWRIDVDTDLTARVVDNVPIGLFGTVARDPNDGSLKVARDQAYYDLAITVDPGNANIIYVAGSLVSSGGSWNASLYKLTISGTAASDNFQADFLPANFLTGASDPTFIGDGAHPDVHIIAHTTGGVWIGCDGGVFAQSAGNMRARNSGLAVAEPGFVASHPTLDGPMIAGTQDNGRIERVSDTIWRLWRKGDGGGTAFHPGDPAYYIAQYTSATWSVNGGRFSQPVLRTTGSTNGASTSEKRENRAANFYSGVAVIAGSGDAARVALGTNRVWFTNEWEPGGAGTMDWVTLPSGTDPRGGATPNDGQDKLTAYDSSDWVETLKWARPGTETGGRFDGQRLLVLTYLTVRQYTYDATEDKWSEKNFTDEKKKDRITSNSDIPDGALDRLPRLGRWTDIATHDPGRGAHGSFYVAATGLATITETGDLEEADKMDTLWWFDGDDTWHPTGLRNAAVDTTTGTGGSKAPAYAVVVDPDAPHDIVYVGNAMGVWRGRLSFSGDTPSWEWRGLLHGLPQAVVQDLSIYQNGSLKILRAALQSRGVWELDISASPESVGKTYLRSHNLDTRRVPIAAPLVDPLSRSTPPKPLDLAESPDVYAHQTSSALPWSSGLPTEAELFAATEAYRNASAMGKLRFAPFDFEIFVMVHHRHTRRMGGADARVLLLRLDAAPDDLTAVALNLAWRQAVMALFDGSGSTAPADWQLADSASAIRSPADPIDARTPRAVKFDVSLSHGFASGTRQDSSLLLAVVTSTVDPITIDDLDHANLDLLLRNSSHAAARRVIRRTI